MTSHTSLRMSQLLELVDQALLLADGLELSETAIHLNQALCTLDGVGRPEAEEKWVVTPFLH